MMVKKAEKELRPVLNRVSEGNIDPMFQKLQEIFNKVMTGSDKLKRQAYYEAYANIYVVLAIS